MASEPLSEFSPEPYEHLRNRLRTHDKEGAIELYYQLLSAGRSVGEIINTLGPIEDTTDNKNAVGDAGAAGSPGDVR